MATTYGHVETGGKTNWGTALLGAGLAVTLMIGVAGVAVFVQSANTAAPSDRMSRAIARPDGRGLMQGLGSYAAAESETVLGTSNPNIKLVPTLRGGWQEAPGPDPLFIPLSQPRGGIIGGAEIR